MRVFIFEETIRYGVRVYVVVAETKDKVWAHLAKEFGGARDPMPLSGWTVTDIPAKDGETYETVWSE